MGLCLVALSRPALAGGVDDASRAAARQLGNSGVEAYQAGDYKSASEKLEKAFSVVRAPSLGLWSARALVKLGKLVEASERYLEVTRLDVSSGDTAVQKNAQTEAQSELSALTPRIPSLVVRVEGATASEVQLTVDGTPVQAALIGEARPVNPGRHHVEGVWGEQKAALEVEVDEGEQQPALLRFKASSVATSPANDSTPTSAAHPASSDAVATSAGTAPGSRGLGGQKTLALVAGGVGLVGVGLGTFFGVTAKSKHDEAAKYCKGSSCWDARGVTAGEDAYAAGNLSTIGMIVGGVGIAAAITLWATAPASREAPAAALDLGPGSIRMRGTF